MLLDEKHRNYFVPLNRFNIVSLTLSKLTAEHLPWLSCLKKTDYLISGVADLFDSFIVLLKRLAERRWRFPNSLAGSKALVPISLYKLPPISTMALDSDLIETDGGQYGKRTKIMEINLRNAFSHTRTPTKTVGRHTSQHHYYVSYSCYVELNRPFFRVSESLESSDGGQWCCFCGCLMSRMPLIRRFQPPTSSLQPSISQTTPQFRMYSLSSPTQVYQGCSSGR